MHSPLCDRRSWLCADEPVRDSTHAHTNINAYKQREGRETKRDGGETKTEGKRGKAKVRREGRERRRERRRKGKPKKGREGGGSKRIEQCRAKSNKYQLSQFTNTQYN